MWHVSNCERVCVCVCPAHVCVALAAHRPNQIRCLVSECDYGWYWNFHSLNPSAPPLSIVSVDYFQLSQGKLDWGQAGGTERVAGGGCFLPVSLIKCANKRKDFTLSNGMWWHRKKGSGVGWRGGLHDYRVSTSMIKNSWNNRLNRRWCVPSFEGKNIPKNWRKSSPYQEKDDWAEKRSQKENFFFDDVKPSKSLNTMSTFDAKRE